MAPFLGQVVQGCLRKLTKQKAVGESEGIRQHLSCMVPVLTFLRDSLGGGSVTSSSNPPQAALVRILYHSPRMGM